MSKQAHTVTAHHDGYFSVLSGNSGKTYRVTPLGGPAALCECEAFRFRGECSHIEAVRAFADETLKAWAEAMVESGRMVVGEESPVSLVYISGPQEDVFAHIERSERDPYGRYLTPWPGEKTELL